jgi:RNA polymerase sigma factor (sigma-70 family)
MFTDGGKFKLLDPLAKIFAPIGKTDFTSTLHISQNILRRFQNDSFKFIATYQALTCLINQVSIKTGNNLPDQFLVERVLRGNTNAFGEIIKKTEGLVAQIVFKMINNPEDRKDISQDIYLKTFHHLVNFKFQSKLSTWIGQIAYNTCLNYLEKKKLVLSGDLFESYTTDEQTATTEKSALSGIAGNEMESSIFKKELSGILRSKIEMLSPIYKTLITLYHHEELSYAEIGEITELPEGTVKNYLFRARKTLKENLLSTYKREEL